MIGRRGGGGLREGSVRGMVMWGVGCGFNRFGGVGGGCVV